RQQAGAALLFRQGHLYQLAGVARGRWDAVHGSEGRIDEGEVRGEERAQRVVARREHVVQERGQLALHGGVDVGRIERKQRRVLRRERELVEIGPLVQKVVQRGQCLG